MALFEEIPIDVEDLLRRLALGQSMESIAGTYGCSAKTLKRRKAAWDARHPANPEPSEKPESVPEVHNACAEMPEGLKQSLLPSVIAAEQQTLPEPPMVEPRHQPPTEAKVVLLVRGELNAAYCAGYKPEVVGINADAFTKQVAAQFANATRILVCISLDSENPSDANLRFVQSFAANEKIRGHVLVSNLGVRSVAKVLLWRLRDLARYGVNEPDADTLAICGFIPLPQSIAELQALCQWSAPDVALPTEYREPWMAGGSAATAASLSTGVSIEIPNAADDDSGFTGVR